MNKLEAWKAKSRRDLKLRSGVTVTVELTTIRDELLAGRFQGPVLVMARQMESNTFDSTHDLTDEELTAFSEIRCLLIAATVKAVDGEVVELTAADVDELPVEDQDELWLYAMRLKALPKPPA
jgi:hypothetical protein